MAEYGPQSPESPTQMISSPPFDSASRLPDVGEARVPFQSVSSYENKTIPEFDERDYRSKPDFGILYGRRGREARQHGSYNYSKTHS